MSHEVRSGGQPRSSCCWPVAALRLRRRVSSAAPQETLTVFAAASLKKTFTRSGSSSRPPIPGTKVSFNFAGSSDLVTQLQQGAPADVFASADTKNMAKATGDHLVAGTR